MLRDAVLGAHWDPERPARWNKSRNHELFMSYIEQHPDGLVGLNDFALRELATKMGIRKEPD
jgi:hypothetical protein